MAAHTTVWANLPQRFTLHAARIKQPGNNNDCACIVIVVLKSFWLSVAYLVMRWLWILCVSADVCVCMCMSLLYLSLCDGWVVLMIFHC